MNILKKVIIALAIILLVYAFFEPYNLQVKEYTFESEDIPESFDGKTLAYLSDFHYGKLVGEKWIEKAVEKTNAQNPDIILLGGDYITGEKELLEDVFSVLGKLRAKNGIYCVIGNHEWPFEKEYVQSASKNAITPVDRSVERVFIDGESILIAGSEFFLRKKPDMHLLEQEAEENDFVIYLQHNPDLAEELKNEKIDLMVSGHTHGGQITFFGMRAPYVPTRTGEKFRTGFVENDPYPVIVSNGVGVYVLPLRLGAPPQIVLIKLKRK